MNFDPNPDLELLALLREIDEDPEARLFRTGIPRPERLVLGSVPRVGLHAAGLTHAEREVLRVYREDVAKLLRDAAEWRIQQDPVGAARSSAPANLADPLWQQDRVGLLDALGRAATRLSRLIPDRGANSTESIAQGMLRSESTSAYQFAGLSLRFVPHDAAWIQIGRAMILEEKLRPALRTLFGVVHRRQSTRMEGCALTCVGSAYGILGSSSNAAHAYAAAAERLQDDPGANLSSLAEAVHAGIEELIELGAERVDSHLPTDDPSLEQWISTFKCRRRLGLAPRLGDQRDASVGDLENRVGPASWRLIDALR